MQQIKKGFLMTHIRILVGAQDAPAEQTTGNRGEITLLHALRVRLVDTLAGFDKVLERAEPEFVDISEGFRGLLRGRVRLKGINTYRVTAINLAGEL